MMWIEQIYADQMKKLNKKSAQIRVPRWIHNKVNSEKAKPERNGDLSFRVNTDGISVCLKYKHLALQNTGQA